MDTVQTVDLTSFEEDGFAIVRGAVRMETLDGVRMICASAVDDFARDWLGDGLIADPLDDLPFEKRYAALREQHPAKFPDTWRRILVSPEVHALWLEPGILDVVRSILGEGIVAHGTWNGRPREPRRPVQRIPWHQDAHYYAGFTPEEGRLLTCWIPLVAVDERAGCLQVVRGSHRTGWVDPHVEAGQFAVQDADVTGERVSCVMEPGDVLLFDALVLHRALDNVADYVRWNLDIRFGQDTPAITAKNPQGFRVHPAPEPFEAWARRYAPKIPHTADTLRSLLGAEGETADDIVRAAGLSRSELEAW